MFIFHLYEYATDVLCKFGELILREPYGYELNGDIFMLPLSDDALVNDTFRQPPKEEESPICAWDQLSRRTSIELSLATGQEYVVWQNRGSLASRSVDALDFDEVEVIRNQATDNGSNSGASDGSSTWCSACGGICICFDGTNHMRRLLTSTTDWVDHNCVPCRPAGSGNCSYCGDIGKS